MRQIALAFVVGLACVGVAGSLPPELRKAAAVAEADHRGVMGFQITWDTDAHGGPFHQNFHYRAAYVYDGTRLIGARAIEKIDNGRAGTQADLDAQTKQILSQAHASDASGFAVPFDSRHFDEYRFERVACDASCLAGDTEISFLAAVADPDHGDGRLIVDRDGHVRHLAYVPKVKPTFGSIRVRDAAVTIDRAAVLPGFWATTKIESRYTGRYGFISGQATQTTRYDHYHRFRSGDVALSALASGDI